MGKQIEQRLNWQIVSLSGPAGDLADAPVLYISGDQALNFSPEQMRMLKNYVEQGGIILYMTGKGGLHRRGGGFQIADIPTTAPAERTVTLARIRYNGNWDPEPGGWRRLAASLHNQYRVGLSIKTVKLGQGQLQSAQIAHLTGTEEFKLDETSFVYSSLIVDRPRLRRRMQAARATKPVTHHDAGSGTTSTE